MRERHLLTVCTAALFLGLSVVLLLPFFSGNSWLIFVQDDLLYYLKVAQNIAHGHGSTFNGVVATNGYQPLWLLLLVGLSCITSNSTAILVFFSVTSLISAWLTFCLTKRLLAATGAAALPVFALAAWATLYSMALFFYCMEVTLTVPLMLGVLCVLLNLEWLQRGWRPALGLGLLLSAMVLSRIDTLIFGGLILAGIVCSGSLRRLIRLELVFGVLLGMSPLVVYFILNHLSFHTWLPVSGVAKELRRHHFPSLEPWRVFFHPSAIRFTTVIVAAGVLLLRMGRQFSPIQRVLFSATLAFPFVYYFILSCVSDWTLWGWYMYPLRTGVCVGFVIFLSWKPTREILERRWVALAMVGSVFLWLIFMRWTHQQTDIYAASVEIQQFAKTHPGIYAMGDRAGRVAYLIPNPVIQTEGLMMDRAYLENINHEAPLRDVLKSYDVRYYVATAYEPFSGCFEAVEPAKAGPDSKTMRSEFCEPANAVFEHDGIETLIYDLGQR